VESPAQKADDARKGAQPSKKARVNSTASFGGRFQCCSKRRCAPILIRRIRTSGRQARRGGKARCLARELQSRKILYAYGNMRRIFLASDGSTSTECRRCRMRFGFFVPSRWRLNACARMILPVLVTRKRFAAPRCVFSLRTFGFAFDNSAPVALSQFHKTAKN
jgi:hypothetical protein